MNPTSQHKEKGPGALRPRRDGLPGSSPQRPPALAGAGRDALPEALQRQFYCDPITRIHRYPNGTVKRSLTQKPHIKKCPRTHKWICANFFAFHRATSPVYAWRGFVRACMSKHKFPRGFRRSGY